MTNDTTPDREITAAMTINEIVQQYPETLPVLARHGIDTCCGGNLSLSEVARRHRINFLEILTELEGA